MFKLKITCREANEICDRSQYDEASFMDKVRLNLHLLSCKVCALYTKQNKLLTKNYKHKAQKCKLQTFELDDSAKEQLKEQLKKQAL